MRGICNRVQKEDESITDFAYALMTLADKLTDLSGGPDKDQTLKEQFRDGLKDGSSRREIKRLLKDKPTTSFIDLRDWALDMAEDENGIHRPQKTRKVGQYAVEATHDVSEALLVLSSVVKSQTDVLEAIQKQQTDFQTRLEIVEKGRSYHRTPRNRQNRDISQVECYRCHEGAILPTNAMVPEPILVRKTRNTQPKSPGLGVNQVGKKGSTSVGSNIVGSCPTVVVRLGVGEVRAVVDTGSQVTTISKHVFDQCFPNVILSDLGWLTLTSANGARIPYQGYFETDICVSGVVVPGRGILVLKDSASSPMLVGMNVLQELPPEVVVRQLKLPRHVCLDRTNICNIKGIARVAGNDCVWIPAQASCLVKVTCGRLTAGLEVLVEPCENLPRGLVATPALICIPRGNVSLL
ncbi:hypothetical protein BSL78_17239, partial [Apostichopus japonicus]